MSSLPGRFLFGVLVDSGTLLFGVLVERYGVSASGSVLPGPRRPREGPQGLVGAYWELPNGDSNPPHILPGYLLESQIG